MRDDPKRRQVAEALERLRDGVASPRALAMSASDRAVLEVAVERVRAQWLGPSEPVLTIALAGGTGTGKSTLINALAGQVIAEASEIRPTTRHLQVYHHRDDSLGDLTAELAGEATFVAHDRPELRLKMIVDAPDLDSFVVRHRATTKALLKRSGLVLYVFSPERYLEERTWSVLREETAFSACAAVLNKVDRVGSPEELEQVGEDLREHFAALGLGDIRIFRVCARAHVPEVDGTLPGPAPAVDDMVALRAFIERELHASEIAQLLRRQRVQGLARLRAEIDRAAPEAIPDELAEVAEAATQRAELAASRLAEALADTLAAVESELAPLVTLRRHELFWGPFRTWLAVTDFLGFGLNSLAGRFLGRGKGDRLGVIQRILSRGGETAVDDVLRAEAHGLQDILYARGLPVERWRALTTSGDAARLLGEVAIELEVHFDLTAAKIEPWRRFVVGAASTIGGLVPSAFVLAGLYVMGRDIVTGGNAGLALLGRLGAMVILFFLALQGVVSATLPGGTRWLGIGVGPQAVRKVLKRTLGGWIAAYRADLAADVANLREPLARLQAELDAGDSPTRPDTTARLPHATGAPAGSASEHLKMTGSP